MTQLTEKTKASARELVIDLVNIPSVSGDETDCATRLVEFFEEQGREVYLDEVGNVRAPGTEVLLTSHIDTVPGDIPVHVSDDILWGRGSVDAKGSVAAMAMAAVETGASFVGVVGEEAESRGARYLIEDRDAPETLINGEPSGWEAITLGYRGFLAGTYVATSETGHSSRPEPNAIQQALDWWRRVETTVDGDDWAPIFDQVTPKPVAIDGGPSEDGLSVEITLEVQFRIPPQLTSEELREIADGELEIGTIQWQEPYPPVLQSPRTEPARRLRAAIRSMDGDPRQLRKTGTSDMNLYAAAWECPMVTYGPGDAALDHTPNERLSLEELDKSLAVLIQVGNSLS